MRTRRLFSLLLAGVLQVMPLVRTMIPMQAQGLAPSSWAFVLKVAAGAVALLSSYHTVSGATSIVTPYTVNAQVGTPYSRQLTTSGQTAHSWSADTAAVGSTVFPLTPGLWLTNKTGKIGGTPTAAVVSNITISAWENSGNTGAHISSVFVFTITNAASGGTSPSITTQPRSQTNYVGSNVTFTVTATGTPTPGYQWRSNTVNITGATSSSYTKSNLQLADAANYTVVVANSAGSVTSSIVALTVVVPQADLVVACSGTSTVVRGGTVNYTVTVTNLGPVASSSVVVSDVLAAGMSFVSATGGGVNSSGTVSWPAISSLAVGAGNSYSITATAVADGLQTNSASGTSSTSDPNSANNNGTAASAKAVTTVTPVADVAALVNGPVTVNANSGYSYTVVVTNLGPSTASNIVVSDVLPSTAAFVSATGGGANTAGTVTWPAIASLAASGTASFTVNVTAPATGSLTNTVSASASTSDPVASNNDGSSTSARAITAVGQQADLVVLQSGPASVQANASVSYTITVTNLGPSSASNVVVSDSLPGVVSFVSASGGGVNGSGTVTWPTIGSLVSGAGATFTVNVTAPASGTFTNSAAATSVTTDPNAANNDGSAAASRVVTAVTPPADITATVAGPASVNAGSSFNYNVTVTNLGPSTASNVVVSDVLPATVSFVSATGGGVNNSGTVAWPAIASLIAGGSTSFTITVTAPATGSLSNVVSATASTPDPVASNNDGTAASAHVITTVVGQADLIVVKTGPTSVLGGSNLTYTITVTNLGPSTASNVVVWDTLPAVAAFVSANSGGANVSGTVTWPTITSLPVGARTNYTVTVTAPGSGTFTNVAQATSATADPNNANNNGTGAAAQVVTAVVTALGQYSINVTSSVTFNPQTGLFEATIQVTNTGPITVAAVRVYVDGLRSGVQVYNASGTNGGRPYVEYDAPLNPNQAVQFLLEFYVPDRAAFTYTLQAVTTLPVSTTTSSSGSFAISRSFTDANGHFVIEFATTPGQTYTIIYSDDTMVTWHAATPSITAAASVTQWVDDGPPKTLVDPASVSSRFYKVIAAP